MVVILFGAKSFSDKKETIDSFVNAEYKQRAVVWMHASLHKNDAAIRWRKEGIGNRSLCCDTKQQGEKKTSSSIHFFWHTFARFLGFSGFSQLYAVKWKLLTNFAKGRCLKWPRKKHEQEQYPWLCLLYTLVFFIRNWILSQAQFLK